MSRARLSYVLAFFGILITTGGCSSSATAPEAATAERATASAKKAPAPEETSDAPESSDGDDVSTTGSGLLTGGGRS